MFMEQTGLWKGLTKVYRKWKCQQSKGYTAVSIKVVPEQSGKVEYKRKMLSGNRLCSTSPIFFGATLIEIAVNSLLILMCFVDTWAGKRSSKIKRLSCSA